MPTTNAQLAWPSIWSASSPFELTPNSFSDVIVRWGGLQDPHIRRLRAGTAEVPEFRFGPFRLLLGSRTLLLDKQPVECGSRAFDLLHVLLLSRGKVVSKEEIIKHVWPTTCVEESNLRFQMASLRKTLGVHRHVIKTIPGRGYLLTSDWPSREGDSSEEIIARG